VPAAGARASAARAARANAALDASSSSGDSDDPSDSGSDSDMSGSGSGSSDWEGALLDVDDAALADFAANVGDDASAAAEAHALIAAMALGGEGQRRAPRHLRAVLDADGGDSEDGSESSSGSETSSYDEESDEDSSDEEEGGARQVGGSAPSAGWQWHNGGRTMRRGEPGAAAAAKKARKAAHKRPAPGEKAAKRKAAITHKRAERAVGRGFDAASVADAMSSFIAAGGDMMALRPAGKFELRVTAALAAVHGLRCSVQGSGKKRFAVLRSTPHASPPLPGDPRLAALLRGVGAERQERRHHEPRSEPRSGPRSGGRPPRATPQSGSARRAQRMAFVSGGRIGGEDDGEVRAAVAEGGGVALEASFVAVQAGPDAMMMAEVVTAAITTPALAQNRGLRRAAEAAAREAAKLARRRGGSGGPRSRHRADADGEAAAPNYAPHGDFGDFERHTTGFGSRMLGKMGFAGAGAGLGRDGAGRAEPILPTMRGKGLGLGAN